jgi:hypothetical protein
MDPSAMMNPMGFAPGMGGMGPGFGAGERRTQLCSASWVKEGAHSSLLISRPRVHVVYRISVLFLQTRSRSVSRQLAVEKPLLCLSGTKKLIRAPPSLP